ncbi:nuclear transport factor 2 family protein [Tomitella fengzijianii]|uniref:Nuclear transport factor 2 family protein n=1 Tax=Tomitella fengzijianii TaxID=2597660 RepID=A0A516WZI3_9ACTN|nr:nuclear transport factor 2 family protein [Tomitella fengzijianii]QDQ96259.1 nuclear transport factor 2 family protein [Tomitella fengzijianii]
MSGACDSERIRSLIARIAHLADDGTVEEYCAQFAPDAEWEMPEDPRTSMAARTARGVDEIARGARERRAAGTVGEGSHTRHVVNCSAIDVADDGESATAVSLWQFYVRTDEAPRVVNMGRYLDEFTRVGGRWVLAKRTIRLG